MGSFAPKGVLSLRAYLTTYSDPDNYRLLWVTLWLAAVRTVLATGLAIFFAWIITRTNTPRKGLLEALIWGAFFMPSLPAVLGWMTLALPKTGLLNIALARAFGLETPLFNIQSYGGIIFASVLPWTAVLFLLITPAFKGMDASLEEASRTAGASSLTTLRRVTIPLLAPALLGVSMLALVRMMESFEIELFLGLPARIFVFTTRVYDRMSRLPPNYDQALALSTIFVVLVVGLMIYQWRLLRRSERYTVITGRAFSSRPMNIGRWRYLTFALVIAYFVLAVVVPVGAVVLGTFQKVPGLIGVKDPLTLEHYRMTLTDTQVPRSVVNTAIVAAGAATLGMLFYSIVSYAVVRTRAVLRPALEFFSWLPYAVPAIVLALGFLWSLVGGLNLPFAAYGSLQLLVLIFVIRGMPLGVRVINGAMIQQSRELEESSRVLGASWSYTFRRVVAPLMRPAFLSAWIILFAIAIRDVASIILLYSAKSRMISVLLMEYWTMLLTGRANVLALIMVALTAVGVIIAIKLGLRQTAAA